MLRSRRTKPVWTISRTLVFIGFLNIISPRAMVMCPPSRTGNGSRLKMARLMLKMTQK